MSGHSISSPLSVPIYIVDAFTDIPFYGNPAAVCLLSPGLVLNDEQMQRIGAEMNLSETAFISLTKGDFVTENTFGLRWFSPASEMDLCGHATLASSAVLFKELGNSSSEITFTSRSGPLTVKMFDKSKISLNFPENAPSPVNAADYKNLLEIVVTDQSLIQDVQLNPKGKLLVRLRDDVRRWALLSQTLNVDRCLNHLRETIETLKPQINKMIEADATKSVKGLGITLKGSRENGCVDSKGNVYDFVSRYFSPWFGVPEDPVTGSWHTLVGPYWAKELNKLSLYAHQCSKRGGDLWVTVDKGRVILTGDSVLNLRGTFSL